MIKNGNLYICLFSFLTEHKMTNFTFLQLFPSEKMDKILTPEGIMMKAGQTSVTPETEIHFEEDIVTLT